jgi:NADPH:quinone reductase-like Zn-dependent oxidoreductase
LDAIGGAFFKKDMNCLRAGGRVIGLGASSFIDRSFFNIPSLLPGLFSMLTLSAVDMMLGCKSFVGANLKELADKNRPLFKHELKNIMKMVENGQLTPVPTTTMPWTDIGKAHSMLENRKTTGKLVMLVD